MKKVPSRRKFQWNKFNCEFVREVGFWQFAPRFIRRQFRKRIFGSGTSIVLPTGLIYHAPSWDPSGSEVIYTGANLDWGSEALLARIIDREGAFIDIGAHTGYYALYMAPLVVRVFAFEPDATAFEALTANLIQAPNAEPVRAAVSSVSGTAVLTVGEGGFSQVASLHDWDRAKLGARVPVVTIDSWMTAHPGLPVTGIKIDVDGHDLEVLRGAAETIARDRAIVLTEFFVGLDSTNDYAGLAEIVSRLGYYMFAYCIGQGRNKTFQRIGVEGLNAATFKMLFLVPPEKLNDMRALSKDFGHRLRGAQ